MKNKTNWLVLALLGLSLLLGISIALRSRTAVSRFFATDDAFYYFEVAKNISEGKGITFDGIARANGYHPLWMLVCVPVFALARLSLWAPLRALIVVQALMHAATGYIIYRLLIKKVSQPLSLLAMAIWLFRSTIFSITASQGLETGINMLCLSALLLYVSTWSSLPASEIRWKHYLFTGILAALTLLARLDNIYLLSFLGAWLVLKDSHLKRTWIYLDFFLAAAGLIFGFIALIGLSDLYYNIMPQIKLLLVASMIVYPLGQFLLGIYHQEIVPPKKPALLLRILTGTIASMLVLYLPLTILYPQRAETHIALLMQAAVFAVVGTLAKLFVPALNGTPTKPASPNQKFTLRAIVRLPWGRLIGKATGYFAPLFGVLGTFLAFNHFYFGSAIPLSGKIKAWWGSLSTVYGSRPASLLPFLGLHDEGPWHFITSLLRPFSDRFNMGLSPNQLSAAVMGLILAALLAFYLLSKELRERINTFNLQPLTLGILFHAGYYTMTGYVGYRSWYWAVERLYVLLLGMLALDVVIALGLKRWTQLRKPKLSWVITGTALLVLVATFIRFNLLTFPWIANGEDDFLANTRLLEQCTEPGSRIGMTGGGIEGYFISGRTIVNLDGLINGVEFFDALTEMRLDDYLDIIDLDYFLGKETMLLDSEPYMEPLAGRLVEIDPPGCDFIESMILYEFVPQQ